MSFDRSLFFAVLYGLDAALFCLAVYEWDKRKTRFLLSAGMAAVLFVWVLYLTGKPYAGRIPLLSQPGPLKWAVLALFLLNGLLIFIYGRRRDRKRLSASSVKEALDDLPGGVCFFGQNGMPVLCNRKMYAIAYELLGRSLQTEQELSAVLAQLPDKPEEPGIPPESGCRYYRSKEGQNWMFRESKVADEGQDQYTRILAYDLTQLYNMSQMRTKRNEELQKMIDRLSQITENIAVITREQELLSAKMLVHNRMGSCILTSRRFLTRGLPREEKPDIAEGWRQMLAMLYNSTDSANDNTDEILGLQSLADSLGIELHIDGTIPLKENLRLCTASAIREALTNTISHAGGTRMDVVIRDTGRKLTIEITNNGTKPDGPIREGGGLSSLRRLTEEAGGTMETESEPAFCLRLIFPEGEETL